MFDFLTQAIVAPPCQKSGCGQRSVYNKLCATHYKETRKEVREAKERERKKTRLERLFDQAMMLENGCIQVGPMRPRITVEGIRVPAYRFVYEHITGDFLTSGFSIHHTCLNERCINPKHLKKVTNAEHRRFHTIIRDKKTGQIIGVKHHSHS